MSYTTSSNVTSGFIDLATFDELEKYLYGGSEATTYFVRETRKSTWFTQVPVVLSRGTGSPGFGQEWSVQVSRAGDYLLHTWLRLSTPALKLLATNGAGNADARLRWTRNLMHNLISDCTISFNDLVAGRFDNYFLDFWTAFTVPSSKRNGYNNMIGNVSALTSPTAPGTEIPSQVLNLPLPFFFSRDSGVALPTAALPYNEMRITFTFRNWTDLLILENCSAATVTAGTEQRVPIQASDLEGGIPTIQNAQVWANYAIVSNDERKRMACAPRDLLIEQHHTVPRKTVNPSNTVSEITDVRLSHAVKALFFGVRNTTHSSEWSNYTTASPVNDGTSVDFTPPGVADPMDTTSLVYENTTRLGAMGADYYSLVNPFYHAESIPTETGYHMYSYALDVTDVDPMGSTNFGKLTNVSIGKNFSDAARAASAGGGAAGTGTTAAQKFEFVATAVNNNIIRVSGGALGFPVL
jgi:hypothetical protein